MKKIFSFLLVILMAIVVASCTKDNTEELLKEAKDALTIIFQTGDSAESVTKNITLVTVGKHGATITWSSSNTSIIANDGKVTRPANGQGDKEVTLTATITINEKQTTKEFKVKVIQLPKTDAEKVNEAKEQLAITFGEGDNAENVTQDLTLPTKVGEATVTWVSTDPEFISTTGKVTRPAYNEADITVVLTATLKVGSAEAKKDFILVVKARDYMLDNEIVDETLKEIIILSNQGKTKGNFALPVISRHGANISWASSDTDYITVTETPMGEGYVKAKVTRPAYGEEDVEVTLTATVTAGEVSKTKEFTVLVEARTSLVTKIAAVRAERDTVKEYTVVATVIGIKVNDQYKGMYIADDTDVIYVHNKSTVPDVQIGDLIELSGKFALYYGAPQLQDAVWEVLDNNQPIPEPVVMELKDFPKQANVYLPDHHMKWVRLENVKIGKSGQYHTVTQGDITYTLWDQTDVEGGEHVLNNYIGKTVNIHVVADSFHSQVLVWRFSYNNVPGDIEEVEVPAAQQLEDAMKALELPSNVYTDIELPNKIGNVDVTWNIPNNDVLAADGTITRPIGDDETITITAKFTIGELEDQKTYTITIKAWRLQTIENVLDTAAKDDIVDVEGIVLGILRYGYLLYDGTHAIYVYTGNAPTDIKLGDQLRITGEFTIYNDQPEIQNIKVTVKLEDGEYEVPEAEETTIEDVVGLDKTDRMNYGKFITIEGTIYEVQVDTNTNTYIRDINGNVIMIHYHSATGALKDYVNKYVKINVYIYNYDNKNSMWTVAYIQGNDVEEVELDEEDLIDSVHGSLTLPSEATTLDLPKLVNGVAISWSSNNENVVAIDDKGNVTINRPNYEYVEVTLTATLTLGDYTRTKEFTVKILGYSQYIEDVRELDIGKTVTIQGIITFKLGNNVWIQDETAAIYLYLGTTETYNDKLVIGNKVRVTGTTAEYQNLKQISNITAVEVLETNVALPEVVTYDTIAELINANVMSQVVKFTGVILNVSTPSNNQYNVTITDGKDTIDIRVDNRDTAETIETSLFVVGKAVTVTAPLHIYRTTYQFMVSKPADMEFGEDDYLTYVYYKLSLGDVSAVTKDLTLPTTFENIDGLTISWESDDDEVIDNEGKVTRPGVGEDDAVVILTATIEYNGQTKTKEFEVTVLAETEEAEIEYEEHYKTGFEDASKSSSGYGNGSATSNGKSWYFSDALIDGQDNDKKVGSKSTRIRAGYIQTEFTVTKLGKIEFLYARYGSDAGSTMTVAISKDGTTWITLKEVNVTNTALEKLSIIIDYTKQELVDAGITEDTGLYIRISYAGSSNPNKRLNVDEVVIYTTK